MASEILSEPEQLRDNLVARAVANSDFTGALILSRKTANLKNEIERNLASEKAGIIVILPTATFEGYHSRVVTLNQRIIFRCVCGIGNKTGKSALYFATRIAAAFQLYRPPFDFCQGPLHPEEPGMRELNIVLAKAGADESEDYAGFDVFFQNKLSIKPTPV